ncbi:MAG: ABC transporter permease [Bacilli bacterium]|nr:ABC transporter permease [Bacilli bacterium]
MSKEYKIYLKRQKKRNFLIHTTRIIILLLIIIIWQILANNNIINAFITSSPNEIVKTILSLAKQNNLLPHIYTTTYETIISFILGTLLGIIIAIILWYNKFLAKVIDPYLTVLNSLPKVSLGPILIIWFGANIKSIIIMAILVSVIVTIITIYNAFKETDITKINLLKSFGANKLQILKYLIIPANYPTIISSLKISISQSLIGVIMGELLVSKKGIGYLIMYGSQVFNLNLVASGIIILMLVSYIMYLIITYIEKILIKHN